MLNGRLALKLDRKDEEIRERDAAIETLTAQLAAAASSTAVDVKSADDAKSLDMSLLTTDANEWLSAWDGDVRVLVVCCVVVLFTHHFACTHTD